MDKQGAPVASFNDFLVERNDAIDNAAYGLALEMLHLRDKPDSETAFPWNMEIIGAILESTQGVLASYGYAACWPFREEDVPCFQTASCAKNNCPLKGQRRMEK